MLAVVNLAGIVAFAILIWLVFLCAAHAVVWAGRLGSQNPATSPVLFRNGNQETSHAAYGGDSLRSPEYGRSFTPETQTAATGFISPWNMLRLFLCLVFWQFALTLFILTKLNRFLQTLGQIVTVIVDAALFGASGIKRRFSPAKTPEEAEELERTHSRRKREFDMSNGYLRENLRKLAFGALNFMGLKSVVKKLKGEDEKLLRDKMRFAPQTMERDPSSYPFLEDYEILEQIPSGGSTAKLFKVRKTGGRDLLVLKYFDLLSGGQLENIVRESGAVQSALRMGLVLDAKTTGQGYYYVMPYYEGRKLTEESFARHRHVAEGQPLPVKDLDDNLAWMREVLEEVSRFHANGLFHKDIKPDNIIVNARHAHLIDLGLVTPMHSSLLLTTHGTEYFRDPHMVKLALQGARINETDCARFDLYSLGATFYFMLEGGFPASGSLSRYTKRVPFVLQYIANKAMTDMEKRYASAKEMLRDLDEVIYNARRIGWENVNVSHLPSYKGTPMPDEEALAGLEPSLPLWKKPAHWGRGSRQHSAFNAYAVSALAILGLATLGVLAHKKHQMALASQNYKQGNGKPITDNNSSTKKDSPEVSDNGKPALTEKQIALESLSTFINTAKESFGIKYEEAGLGFVGEFQKTPVLILAKSNKGDSKIKIMERRFVNDLENFLKMEKTVVKIADEAQLERVRGAYPADKGEDSLKRFSQNLRGEFPEGMPLLLVIQASFTDSLKEDEVQVHCTLHYQHHYLSKTCNYSAEFEE